MKNNLFSRLMKTIKPYWFFLLLTLISSIGYVVFSLYIPILVGNAIDVLIEKNVNFNQLNHILQLIGLCLIVASILQYIMNLCNNRLTYSMTRDLRNQAIQKIQNLPLKYLDNHSYGDIVSRIISDVETISDGLLLGFNQVFTGVVTIAITLIFMFTMKWEMALTVVVLTPLSLFVAKFISKKIHKYFANQSILKGEQTAFIEEMVNGQKIVRAFNHEEANQKNPTTRFVNALVYALICLIGSIICINTKNLDPSLVFTTGMLTTFLSYASQYTKPFNDISSVVTELQNALTCASRVYDLLDEDEEIQDKKDAYKLENVIGDVELKNIYFSYVENQHLIENFNLKVKHGQKIAIVGPTGCGKTTLINLLMRFYDVVDGSISIDNYDLRDLQRNSIRDNYGMVLQETYLRHASIKDNILMGKEISEERLIEIAKQSHIYNFVTTLKDGFNTIVDDNNGLLSQGQKQLICIARVMVNLPPMLILDEATSSIDTRTELKIQDAFNKMMKGRTSFIVAHRLSTIKEADMIIVMNEGHIIEQGNHQELLKKKGFYYNLYNSQFQQ